MNVIIYYSSIVVNQFKYCYNINFEFKICIFLDIYSVVIKSQYIMFLSLLCRLKQLICQLKEDDTAEIDTETIISNLEYIDEVIQSIVVKNE